MTALALLKHSCPRNAHTELETSALKTTRTTGGVLTLTGLLSWQKTLTYSDERPLLLLSLGSQQAIYPLRKELRLYEVLGVEPERFLSLWPKASGNGGGIALTEVLLDRGRRAVTLLNYTLECALQVSKSTGKIIQGSRIVLYTIPCVDWDAFLRQPRNACSACHTRLTVSDFRQPYVGTSALQFFKLKSSPYRRNSNRSSGLRL